MNLIVVPLCCVG